MFWQSLDEVLNKIENDTSTIKRCCVCDSTYKVYTFTILPERKTEYYCMKHAPKHNKKREAVSPLSIY